MCVQILSPLQTAAFFHQCYPFGADLLSLMAASAAAAGEAAPAEIFKAARLDTVGFQATAEWRQALVQPLSRLRSCGAAASA